MSTIRPNRFKFDAFDAGASEAPIASKDDNVKIESNRSAEKPKAKTLQQHLDSLAEDM